MSRVRHVLFVVVVACYACSVVMTAVFPGLSSLFGYNVALGALAAAGGIVLLGRYVVGITKPLAAAIWIGAALLPVCAFFASDDPLHWLLVVPSTLALSCLVVRSKSWRLATGVSLGTLCALASLMVALSVSESVPDFKPNRQQIADLQTDLNHFGCHLGKTGELNRATVNCLVDFERNHRIQPFGLDKTILERVHTEAEFEWLKNESDAGRAAKCEPLLWPNAPELRGSDCPDEPDDPTYLPPESATLPR